MQREKNHSRQCSLGKPYFYARSHWRGETTGPHGPCWHSRCILQGRLLGYGIVVPASFFTFAIWNGNILHEVCGFMMMLMYGMKMAQQVGAAACKQHPAAHCSAAREVEGGQCRPCVRAYLVTEEGQHRTRCKAGRRWASAGCHAA